MKRQTDDCRAFLESYRELRSEAARLRQKHRRLQDQATRVTTQISGMPHGGGADREKLLAALADADGEAVRKMTEAVERQQEIEAFIDRVPTPISRVILRHRYAEAMGWREVERALAKSQWVYSLDHIYRLHGIALREAREVWKESGNG